MITVAYITGRKDPKWDWFIDSLRNQCGEEVRVLVVDFYGREFRGARTVKPKPTPWQGEHRVTREDWWAMSNARNTAIINCETDWLAFCDDRSVLLPTWYGAVRQAMANRYVVCGSYSKVSGLRVNGGRVEGADVTLGVDSRLALYKGKGPMTCGGGWVFGCTLALPTEWAYKVNGFEEGCDGLSMEDVIFGLNLQNYGFPIKYDPYMAMVEDRTVGECVAGHQATFRREDKGVSPRDKSHAALERFGKRMRTEFTPDLMHLRELVSDKRNLPKPSPDVVDWYDGQPLREM